MAFLKELTDKGATVAWSNVASHPNLIALGTKDSGGTGFDDYGGELELHKLNFARESEGGAGSLLGKVKTSARFATLAWSEMATKQAEYPYGLIAGGMGDGTVNVWDPAKLVAQHPQPQVASVQRHQGAVTGLHFNPHRSSSHLLASGGVDSEVYIIALERPDAPNVFVPGPEPNKAKHTAEVTKVAWNSQVSHIMATAAQNGSCIVWDLRQKKPWCELRDNARAPITDVSWNPDQGLHLVTASGDDNNPVLKLWDLRSSTTLPLATLSGHTQGILSVGWCPNDASLLMSCAKDNRTLLWDLYSLKAVYELPSGAGGSVSQEPNQLFGGYGNTSQRRYQVTWSPHIPTVVATCSFDRKVQLFSMAGARTSGGRAPKWHQRPAGASFGFGGKLVSFVKGVGVGPAGAHGGGVNGSMPGQPQQAKGSKLVRISSVMEDPEFVGASRRFEAALSSRGLREFCKEKEQRTDDPQEKKVWQFMQVIFESNARNQLLAHLGFDGDTVARQAASFISTSTTLLTTGKECWAVGAKITPGKEDGEAQSIDGDGEGVGRVDNGLVEGLEAVDLTTPPVTSAGKKLDPAGVGGDGVTFGEGDEPFSSMPPPPPPPPPPMDQQLLTPTLSSAAEDVIKRSLLVGNFEAAVQCCLTTGNMADAMLLASCGGADLWAKTQAQYFQREIHRRPFLKIVNAIIKSELGGLVESSKLSQWEETLAILSTYAKQEEFPSLCEALARRLETEARDCKSANLCYMCAVKVPKTIEMWAEDLKAANARANGGTDTKALQDFVEKVSVFTQEPNDPPGPEVAAIFSNYAGILASEGEMETAAKYLRGEDYAGAVLMDRLYHAVPGAAPAVQFPFDRQHVGVSPQTAGVAADSGQGVGVSSEGSLHPPALVQAAVPGALPEGWTQMMDPQRGLPYYCNTATGETQWERPTPLPQQRATATVGAPARTGMPVPHQQQRSFNNQNHHQQPQPQGYQQHQPHQQYQAQPAAAVATPASPYNSRGMVSPSPSHQQQMLHRRGASGTMDMAAPGGGGLQVGAGGGGAAVLGGGVSPLSRAATPRGRGGGGRGFGPGQPQSQPPAATPAPSAGPSNPPQLETAQSQSLDGKGQPSVDVQAMVASVNGMLSSLSECQLTAPEKKMLGDVNKAILVLYDKMGRGGLEPSTLTRVGQLIENLQARNIPAATAVHQALADTSWNNHRDWLKGIKHFATLVSRRL